MPIYEYRCGDCGHEFERRQKMSDAPVRKCPECGKPARRVIGAVAGFVRGTSTPCATSQSPCKQLGRCDKRSCEVLER
ncbi:MAG: zinc ribbon domain-containing protein [Planctomycetes bacterium]|nr:zinc ribbon domain-containing protein [Planctomycetota bacterium]